MNRLRIIFMGTPEFAMASLDAILEAGHHVVGVVTAPDKPAGRGKKISESDVKQYAKAKGLNILQPTNLKSPEFLKELEHLQADLQIVVAFRMLPKEVWNMPALGTFNLHASLLPQYRGAAPINWAVINGETETGVTTFLLNEKIDEGNILFSEKTAINPTETAGELHDRLMNIGKSLVVKTIDALVSGTVEPKPQQMDGVSKNAPKIFRETCQIDWTKPGQEIINFIRGLSPYPAAHTELLSENGENIHLKIYRAEFEKGHFSEKTKQIFTDNKSFFKVFVPDGCVKITELQQSGKKNMKINEFLMGFPLSKYRQCL